MDQILNDEIVYDNLYNYIEDKIDTKNISSLKCEKVDYILKTTINNKSNSSQSRMLRLW